MGVLLDQEGKFCEQVVGCDHEPHVARGSEPYYLIVKISGPGKHNLVPAPGKTLVQDVKHRRPFGSKGWIAGSRVLGKQDVHRRYYCTRIKLPYPSLLYFRPAQIGELFDKAVPKSTRVMKPAILLTNDDGVNSLGIWAAYEALAPIADVTVVAPATQQSAVGRSISIFEPIRANKIKINGIHAWAVAGKPTDAVIIGLYALKLAPALVVSGINIGENLSYESIMTSGTMGAALEASNQGTKGIAFSLQVEDQGDKFDDPGQSAQSF